MTLKLAELDAQLEPVQFKADGPEYAFHHIDGISEQLLVATQGASTEARRKALNDIVARCIPDAPRDDIDALPLWKVDLLISLAGKAVESVQEYMEAFQGKAMTTGEGSTSATPSATPSPA